MAKFHLILFFVTLFLFSIGINGLRGPTFASRNQTNSNWIKDKLFGNNAANRTYGVNSLNNTSYPGYRNNTYYNNNFRTPNNTYGNYRLNNTSNNRFNNSYGGFHHHRNNTRFNL